MEIDADIAKYWIDRDIPINEFPHHIYSDTWLSDDYPQWGFEYPNKITKTPSGCEGIVMIGNGVKTEYWPYSILIDQLKVGELEFIILRLTFLKPKTLVLLDVKGTLIEMKGKT